MKASITYGPPGTGKTRHLVEMLNKLAKPGAMFVSHTRAAAFEAVNRFGTDNTRGVDIQTLHSWCFKALKMSKAQTVDDVKLTEFMEDFGLDMSEEGDGKKYVELMSYARARLLDPMQAYHQYPRSPPGGAESFFSFVTSYEDWKSKFGYIDFSDMLARGASMTKLPRHIPMIFIDEAQDLSGLHWAVINNIISLNPEVEIFMAGDDDQALYGFAGADPQGMAKFADKYNVQPEVLGQSFRVPRAVHTVATMITDRIRARAHKPYKPTEANGLVMWEGHLQNLNIDPNNDSLVLYGDKWTRSEVEKELIERSLPYTALNGMPAPLDTKAGRALKMAHTFDGDPEKASAIASCLNNKGKALYDTLGIDLVVDKLRDRDLSVVNTYWEHDEYLSNVNLSGEPKVRISTIHGAKGMEAQDVHLITAQSQAALTEADIDPDTQHRVYYVGVTRSKQNLFIYDGNNSYEI